MKIKKGLYLLKMFFFISGVFVQAMLVCTVHAGHYVSKTDAVLDFIKMKNEGMFEDEIHIVQKMNGIGVGDSFSEDISKTAETGTVDISIRFDHELSGDEIEELEKQGVFFNRIEGGGQALHSGNVYGASIYMETMDALSERSDVIRIESTRKPNLHYAVDVSVPEINADDMWELLDTGGANITGSGVIIADFDSGIDVFHPDFWFADGGSFSWIDSNGNNLFDPGWDAVDLNGNGDDDFGEVLNFFDAEGTAGNADGVFQAAADWLYNDANFNSQRDYGTANGFEESDPAFGERIFIADDKNGNNKLDVGEVLIALGNSKISRTMNAGIERVRGTDLILSDSDLHGHGTSVCGVLNGGTVGMRRFAGVAPDAELLVSHGTDYTVYIPWARENGANIMLYEFGRWVQEFMDGSSNLEQMIDAEAANGIVQIVPAGNLGNKNKHAQADVFAESSVNFTFHVPGTDNVTTLPNEDIDRVYITALWRTPANDMNFEVTSPALSVVNLPASPADTGWRILISGDGHRIYFRREDSTRGTAKYDIVIERIKVATGGWSLKASNGSGDNQHVDTYIADNRTSWSGGALWTNNQANENTIDWPATADSAITVASYSTRGFGGAAAGQLSLFSPEGPRIDGAEIMDIAAPGNYDIVAAMSKDQNSGRLGAYRWFSGTSAAAPHVAGACALLLQWNPDLTHAQIKTLLRDYARTDEFTDFTPNDKWGYGKLDVLAVVNEPPVAVADGPYSAVCRGGRTGLFLDGSGSGDQNAGDVLEYTWTTDCVGGTFDDPKSPTPWLSIDSAAGCHSCNVTLTVSDLAGAFDSSSAEVKITEALTARETLKNTSKIRLRDLIRNLRRVPGNCIFGDHIRYFPFRATDTKAHTHDAPL